MKILSRPSELYRWFWFRAAGNETDRMLMLSTTFSGLLVIARIVYTGSFTFMGLAWNLFLAWLPYLISSLIQYQQSVKINNWKLVAGSFVWLLFIPNSFYILTDLFHLGEHGGVPLWFDLALIISFAWNGLLLGILSVRQMERIVRRFLPGKHELFFIYPIMWLNALGVYIGRYLRYNSWDIITNPFELTSGIVKMLWHPLHYKYVWGMVACFSVFMTLVYLTIKRISKTVH
jgi:uncharacterized membrane protein